MEDYTDIITAAYKIARVSAAFPFGWAVDRLFRMKDE